MARLIDADALKEAIESHVTSMSVCLSMGEHYGKVTMRDDCLTDIDNAPTIDAIPVEWLRKYTAVGVTPHGDRLTEGNERLIVHRILNDWQQEQEAQDGNM